jgi:hypothetical protein
MTSALVISVVKEQRIETTPTSKEQAPSLRYYVYSLYQGKALLKVRKKHLEQRLCLVKNNFICVIQIAKSVKSYLVLKLKSEMK